MVVEPKLKDKAIWADLINPTAPSSSAPLELTSANEISEDYPHTDKILDILKSPVDLVKTDNPTIPLKEGEIPLVMNLNMSPNPPPPSTSPTPSSRQASTSDVVMYLVAKVKFPTSTPLSPLLWWIGLLYQRTP